LNGDSARCARPVVTGAAIGTFPDRYSIRPLRVLQSFRVLKYVGNPGNSHPLLYLHGSCGLFFSHLDETSSHRACPPVVHVHGGGDVDPRRGLRSAVGTVASVVDVAAFTESLALRVSSGARRPHASSRSFCIAKHFRAGGTPGPKPRLHRPQFENVFNFDRIILASMRG